MENVFLSGVNVVRRLLLKTAKSETFAERLRTLRRAGVAINLNTDNVGHSVVMQSVVQRTITKVSGNVVQKYLYYIMNPGNGGSITRLSASSISNAKNIFFIIP